MNPDIGADTGARALHILQTVFGYPAFRGQQGDIVEHVAGGGDALVLMPTGGGKSLCYQIPALLRDRQYTMPESCACSALMKSISCLRPLVFSTME